MIIPENFSEMTKFNTFNELDQTIEIEKPAEVFKNLKILVLIGMDLTWKDVKKIAPFFPNLKKLVVSNNSCNDFEEIDQIVLHNLKNLESLSICNSEIFVRNPNMQDEGLVQKNHKIEVLRQFPNLKELKLENNEITHFPLAKEYKCLTYIN